MEIPFVEAGISAGFPSPALDFTQNRIDLNRELIKNPSSTFYGKVKGDSMTKVGIDNGDLLVIDRSLEPTNNKIAVCYIDGEFNVKRIKIERLLRGFNCHCRCAVLLNRVNNFIIPLRNGDF